MDAKRIVSIATAVIVDSNSNMSGIKDGVMLVPPSPQLKRLGFGTGVSVWAVPRSPARSPWAAKSVRRAAPDGSAKDAAARRLVAEGSLLSRLRHPNVVGFRSFAAAPPLLAMERCGASLGDRIEERRESPDPSPFPKRHIFKMIHDIGSALDYIHKQVFILHGDVKSYNVLVNGDFEICKLCDFGVSLPLNEHGVLDNSKTKDDYVGTGAWAAPEVIYLDKPITDKTDIFSLGLTIWETISLDVPHNEQDIETDTDCSVITVDSSLNDSSIDYGTRPTVPDIDASEYNDVIGLFYCTTVEEPNARPSANQIVMFAKSFVKNE